LICFIFSSQLPDTPALSLFLQLRFLRQHAALALFFAIVITLTIASPVISYRNIVFASRFLPAAAAAISFDIFRRHADATLFPPRRFCRFHAEPIPASHAFSLAFSVIFISCRRR
jgi:hypothetical protein